MGLPVADEEACASTIGLSAKAGYQKLYPDMADEKSLWEAGADWIIDDISELLEIIK